MPRPTIPLLKSGRPVVTVFDLLGRDENDITAALGWGLSRSSSLLDRLGDRFVGGDRGAPAAVRLQHSGGDHGYTDVELLWEHAHLVVEAKRGWHLPGLQQLHRYRPRFASERGAALLTLSECSTAYARHHLPSDVEGVPVHHLSWGALAGEVEAAATRVRGNEKRVLREFHTYLRGVVTVQNLFSNWVYCVSIGGRLGVGGPWFRDFVEAGRYFHPYGVRGWPTTPPNYIAFRWRGHVQRIHHIDSYEVVDTLPERVPEVPELSETMRQHLVYELGPCIGPVAPLPNGAQYRAGRMWVALDLLLTSASLHDALADTRRRRLRKPEDPQ